MDVMLSAFLLPLVFSAVHGSCDAKPPSGPIKAEAVTEASRLQKMMFWDSTKNLLFFVDRNLKTLNSYNPKTNKHVTVNIVTGKSFLLSVTKIKGSKEHFLLDLQNSLGVVRWDGVSTDPLTPKVILEEPSVGSLNGGRPDLQGGLWVGSMENPTNNVYPDVGHMYRVGCDGKAKTIFSPTQVPNGIEFSLKGDKLYYAETFKAQLYQMDYNPTTMAVSNKKIILDWSQHNKENPNSSWRPDGTVIDEQGKLWVTNYGAGKIIRIDPSTGKQLQEVEIPGTLYPTSLQFGGDCLDTLYVTTAVINDSEDYKKQYPDGGKLFKVTGLGVKGTPSREVCLDKSFWQDV